MNRSVYYGQWAAICRAFHVNMVKFILKGSQFWSLFLFGMILEKP